MNGTTDTECALDDCSEEGDYITYQTDFQGNDLEVDPATTCDYARFNGLRGLRIHKARWSKHRNSLFEECKLNDGVMNLDYTHSVLDPIVEWLRPGKILCKPVAQR